MCDPSCMSLYKRGKIWWFAIEYQSRLYQRSTRLTNKNDAMKAGMKSGDVIPTHCRACSSVLCRNRYAVTALTPTVVRFLSFVDRVRGFI